MRERLDERLDERFEEVGRKRSGRENSKDANSLISAAG
jgi:hypothetical protein